MPQSTTDGRWLRRGITIPGYSFLFCAMVATFPALIAIALLVDLLRRALLHGASFTCTRVVIFLIYYLACEIIGISASFLIWVTCRLGRQSQTKFLQRNFDLQCWWGRVLGRGAFAIFGLTLKVECDYEFGKRPVIVLIRHTSVADTVLPVMLIGDAHRVMLRYVLKKELLWDPCLDIVGNRLTNIFVDRGSGNSQQETERVRDLATDLTPAEGVLIYPEGTRFSAAKKAKIEARFAETGNQEALSHSRQLRHLLPPRHGGPLALLKAAPKADVIIMAHSGLEGSSSFNQFWNGKLTGQTVKVSIRAVPFEEVPRAPELQRQWLHEQWLLVDEFVAAAIDSAKTEH
jgi:1-acyl-sn-glycerol-3-phosphate acyltransferase